MGTIILNALGAPEPWASISRFGARYGVGGYYRITAAARIGDIGEARYVTASDAEAAAVAAGYTVTARRKDGYGGDALTIEHTETAEELRRIDRAIASMWAGATPCYVRFGDLPTSGCSTNHADGTAEAGVSVYRGEEMPDGRARPLPSTAAELCGAIAIMSRPLYVVDGDCVGTGSDGEPVLANCRIVRRI